MGGETQTLRDSNAEMLDCKKIRQFYWVREIKLLHEHFWLVAHVIGYYAFGSLTGCLGPICLLIVSLYLMACACTIALPQLHIF